METVALENLAWIHDCTLVASVFKTPSGVPKSIELILQCPTDLGYPAWEGREIQLIFKDVRFMRHTVYNVSGPAAVDAIRSLSPEHLSNAEWAAPEFRDCTTHLKILICFHSGSEMQIACQQIQTNIPANDIATTNEQSLFKVTN